MVPFKSRQHFLNDVFAQRGVTTVTMLLLLHALMLLRLRAAARPCRVVSVPFILAAHKEACVQKRTCKNQRLQNWKTTRFVQLQHSTA